MQSSTVLSPLRSEVQPQFPPVTLLKHSRAAEQRYLQLKVDKLNEVIFKNPMNVQARIQRFGANYTLKNYQTVLTEMNVAEQYPEVLDMKAFILIKMKKWEEFYASLEQTDKQSKVLMAFAAYKKGDYHIALELVRNLNDQVHTISYLVANIHRKLGMKCKELYCSTLSSFPEDDYHVKASLRLGDIAFANGNVNEATLYYLYALELNASPDILQKRMQKIAELPGIGLLKQAFQEYADHHYEEALKRFDSILIERPKHYAAVLGKTQCLKRLRKFADALETLKTFMQSDILPAQTKKLRAEILLSSGKFSEAKKIFDQILAADEKDSDAAAGEKEASLMLNIIYIKYYLSLRWSKDTYNKPIFPSTRSQILRSVTYLCSGTIEKGAAILNKCLSIDPDHPSCGLGLSIFAIVFEKEGSINSSLQYYQQAIEHGFILARLLRKSILEKMERKDLLQEDYAILKKETDLFEVYLLERGKMHFKFGNNKLAVKDIKTFIKYMSRVRDVSNEKIIELSSSYLNFINESLSEGKKILDKINKEMGKGKEEAVEQSLQNENEVKIKRRRQKSKPDKVQYEHVILPVFEDLERKSAMEQAAKRKDELEAEQQRIARKHAAKSNDIPIDQDPFIKQKKIEEAEWFHDKKNRTATTQDAAVHIFSDPYYWKRYCKKIIDEDTAAMKVVKKVSGQPSKSLPSIYKTSNGSGSSRTRAATQPNALRLDQRVPLNKAMSSCQSIADILLRAFEKKRLEYDVRNNSKHRILVRNALLYNILRFFEALKQSGTSLFSNEQASTLRNYIRHYSYLIEDEVLFAFAKQFNAQNFKISLDTVLKGGPIQKNSLSLNEEGFIFKEKQELNPQDIVDRITKELDGMASVAKPILGSSLPFNTLNMEGDRQHALKMGMAIIGEGLRRGIGLGLKGHLVNRSENLKLFIKAGNKVAHEIGDLEFYEFDEVAPDIILKVCADAESIKKSVQNLLKP